MAEEELTEAEKSVLGGCIQNKEIFYRVVGKIEPDDFSLEAHRIIFSDLKEMMMDKGMSGAPAFLEYLKSKKDISKVGGTEYIMALMAYQPLSDEVDYAVNIVKDKALAKKFLDKLHSIQDDYINKSIPDISDFIGEAEKSILEITSQRRVSEFRTTTEVLTSLKAQFKDDFAMRQKLKITESYMTGYSCGFEDVDRLTSGFHPQDLIILAARPSVGKTALALNFGERMARAGRTVGIFSLEMSAESILLRLLSEIADVPTNSIKSMDFDHLSPDYGNPDDQKLKVATAIDTLQREKILIDDTSAQKLVDITSKARKLKARYPELSMIIIDYLGLITNPTKGNAGNRQQEVADITRSLKQMARDLDVPVMVLCQLSRTVETRNTHRPVLSDLRDSGSIEQDADMVFFIFRPDYYKDEANGDARPGSYTEQAPSPAPDGDQNDAISQTTLILAKNRNGRIGDVNFTFYKDVCRFEAIADDGHYGGGEDQ
jgi:replicative DNA helicase